MLVNLRIAHLQIVYLVPNWASAEAQFIPNFSLHTKFFIGGPFEAKFSILARSGSVLDDLEGPPNWPNWPCPPVRQWLNQREKTCLVLVYFNS